MRLSNRSTLVVPLALAAKLVLALGASPASGHGGNQLHNPSFEIEGPAGSTTTFTGSGGGGHAAAEGWGVFNNTEGTTTTQLVPSTLDGGGRFMIHVTTDGGANGLGQVFGQFGEGPRCVTSSAWVYVVSGRVYIGSGNGGNTGPNAFTTTRGVWERIEGDNIVCPANTYIVYSDFGQEGAEFYVDLAAVDPFDCPGPAGDLNENGFVEFGDLLILLASWGACPPKGECPADLDGDGMVAFSDVLLLLHTWGECM